MKMMNQKTLKFLYIPWELLHIRNSATNSIQKTAVKSYPVIISTMVLLFNPKPCTIAAENNLTSKKQHEGESITMVKFLAKNCQFKCEKGSSSL